MSIHFNPSNAILPTPAILPSVPNSSISISCPPSPNPSSIPLKSKKDGDHGLILCSGCGKKIKKRKGGECSQCITDRTRPTPSSPPPPPSPSLTSSSSSSPSKEETIIDVEQLLSPLTSLLVDGKKRKRDDYNYYHHYSNEFFFTLFRDYIDNLSSPINLKMASEYYHIKYSTIKSKYQSWYSNNKGDIGTKDRRGAKRKISDSDEEIIKQQIYDRMNSNKKTQNGHLVDFIMNLYPQFHPSMGFLTDIKKRFNVSSRFTPVVKRKKGKKQLTPDEELDLLCHYYEDVENAINKYGPSGVYNYDEKPLSTAPKAVSTFQFRGKKRNKLKTDNNPKRVYSGLCVVAANGKKLPITILKDGVKKDSPSSSVVAEVVEEFGNYMGLTPSGWVNGKSMAEWIRNVFAVNADLPCALIMDGVASHWEKGVVATANELGIEFISMPPNRTDEIQPLDVGVFGALQAMTDRDWDTDDSVGDYLYYFQNAWQEFSPKTIRQAFYDAIALEEGVLEDEIADKNARQLIVDEKIALNDINYYLKTVIDAIPQ